MIRHRNHRGNHFMLMPLERQVRRHECPKCAESVKKHVRQKRVAGYDTCHFVVIHGMDGCRVFDGIEFALRLDGALDAVVFIHSDSLDPGHSSQLLEAIIILENYSEPPERAGVWLMPTAALPAIAFFV